MSVWLGRRTVQNIEPGHHSIGSVQAVIWQDGTNWAGPVRIQIYYGPECCINPDKLNTLRQDIHSLPSNPDYKDAITRVQKSERTSEKKGKLYQQMDI